MADSFGTLKFGKYALCEKKLKQMQFLWKIDRFRDIEKKLLKNTYILFACVSKP